MNARPARPVAVVTGASAGIGAAYADRLAARGFDLVAVARRRDRLESLSRRLAEAHGATVESVVADLTEEDGLRRVEALLRRPEIAMLVNNAGNGKLTATADMEPTDALSTLALNVTAPTRLTMAVLPGFIARDAGAIVNIASVLALHALRISSLYSGTKAFILNFTRGLQAELAGTGVRVQAVLPAGTATEFFDQSGLDMSPEDLAALMKPEDLVDAALAGFDGGEAVTIPSLHDASLWDDYDAARARLFAGTQNRQPAPRYR